VNCSEIRGVTSAVFTHPLFAFCRHSPQLILRLYYVFIAAIRRGRYLHQRRHSPNRLPTIPELIGSINTSAFVDTNPTGEPMSVHHYSPNALADPGKPLVCSRHYA
jgi:hypothetical protein